MKMWYQLGMVISNNNSSNRSNNNSSILLLFPFHYCISLSINVFNQPMNKAPPPKKWCHVISLEVDENIQ